MNAGSGIGDNLSVIQVNLSRLLRSDPHFTHHALNLGLEGSLISDGSTAVH